MQKKIVSLFLLIFTFYMASCGHIKTRKQMGGLQSEGVTEGETLPVGEDQLDKTQGMALILGPGSVRALAHAGFLQTLERSKVPIKSIVGVEWGAMVAGFYYASGSTSKMQWQLQKLKGDQLPSIGFLSKKYEAENVTGMLKSILPKSVLNTEFPQRDVRFSCPTVNTWSGRRAMVLSGRLLQMLEQCMVSLPQFKTRSGQMADLFINESALFKNSILGEAKHIVYVNVLTHKGLFSRQEMKNHPAESLLWNMAVDYNLKELKRLKAKYPKLIVVNVNVSNQPLFKLRNSNVLFLSGQRAARKLLDQLNL